MLLKIKKVKRKTYLCHQSVKIGDKCVWIYDGQTANIKILTYNAIGNSYTCENLDSIDRFTGFPRKNTYLKSNIYKMMKELPKWVKWKKDSFDPKDILDNLNLGKQINVNFQ